MRDLNGRVIRTWVCPCCRASQGRAKIEERGPICSRCRTLYEAKFSWPAERACKHVRELDHLYELHTYPRMTNHLKFRPTPELRELWRDVRAAERLDSFSRRTTIFIEAALVHARQLPKCRCGGEQVPGYTECANCLGIEGTKSTLVYAVGNRFAYVESTGEYMFHIEKSVHTPINVLRREIIYVLSRVLDHMAGLTVKNEQYRINLMYKMFPSAQLRRRAPRKQTRAEKRAQRLLDEARALLEA